jgi:hypothetical protein
MSFQPQRLPWLNPLTSLQARIGMTTAATAILLSTILSLIVGHISRTQLEAQIQRSLFKLAQQVADQLDQGMFERYRDIRSLAALEALQLINYPPTPTTPLPRRTAAKLSGLCLDWDYRYAREGDCGDTG